VVKTHGYTRQRAVPSLPATTPKVCRACDNWFAARSRESVCDGCVPPSVRTERALKTPSLAHHTNPAPRAGKRAGQKGRSSTVKRVYSEVLGLTFEAPLSDPRAASLECRVLAREAAAREFWKYGRAA
jgi:hypothetical protein